MNISDEEGEGGEEVEQRAYADVRQLEAAATATRKLAGRRKLKALPPVPTARGGDTGATGADCTRGASLVPEKMPLSGNENSSGALKLRGFFAVSRGRQTGEWSHRQARTQTHQQRHWDTIRLSPQPRVSLPS